MALGFLVFLAIACIGLAALFVLRRVWGSISRDQRRLEWLSSRQYALLMIEVPRHNDKTPLAAEQMFASLHGIQQPTSEFQEHVSFEIVAQGSNIRFYVFCPVHLRDFVEGQIYAQYPAVEIVKVDDYTGSIDLSREHLVSTELQMTKADVYPIKTFANFNVDPLAGITAPLAKLEDNEQVWIQLLIRPVDDSWQTRGTKFIENVRAGATKVSSSMFGSVASGIGTLATDAVREAASPGSMKIDPSVVTETKLSGATESGLKGVEEKITKLGFATKIRIVSVAADMYAAQSKVMSVVGAFKQFNTTNLNGFTAKQMTADSKMLLDQYAARSFEDSGLVLNIEELASLYHLPNITVETPNIAWTRSKKGEPPGNLPIVGQVPAAEITRIGKTNFRNSEKEFGIKLLDRRRHTYVIGKSGVGKSTLLENMMIDDVNEGRGVILVDPHGETYEHVLAAVPEHRINDVILFDPSDRMYPIGFNLLEAVDEDLKGIVASGFVGIFEKMFSNSWGPRLEHILRNTVLALLEYPGSTMLAIPKMLTDKKFRQGVVDVLKDPVIKDFWENEFASWDQKFATEAVAPILNKVGQFISAATIRNIVGQSKSTFDVRRVMDEGKILLINLSRGKIGEDNSAMLGAMMITKIQLAAMSRADVPENERTDSYLYVDEFQNFATRSFATILSEARKYRLNLIMTNQYIAQIPEEVRDAVFGNVGTIVAFRVGAADASELVQEFTPEFLETDLVNQDIHKIYIKMSIEGLTGQAFSANTLGPVRPETNYSEPILEQSRHHYSRDRADVEHEIGTFRGEEKMSRQSTISDGTITLPAIKINPANIINGLYYKELHAAGGVKWWEGQPIEQVVADEEKKRQKYLAKRVDQLKNGTFNRDTFAAEDVGEGPESTTPAREDREVAQAAINHAINAAKTEVASLEEVAPQPVTKPVGETTSDLSVSKIDQKHDTEKGSVSASYAQGYGKTESRLDREEIQKEGSVGLLRSPGSKGPAPVSVEKNDLEQGTGLGERVQPSHSALPVHRIETSADTVKTVHSPFLAPKNANFSNVTFLNRANPSDVRPPDSKSSPTEIRTYVSPGHAHNATPTSSQHAPKAPQSSKSPEKHHSATNDHPKPILAHFIATHQTKTSQAHEAEDSHQKEHPKQPAGRHSIVDSSELDEGVAHTFS